MLVVAFLLSKLTGLLPTIRMFRYLLIFNPFSTNAPPTDKPGSWFLVAKFKSQNYLASKNQLSGFYICRTLVENGSNNEQEKPIYYTSFRKLSEMLDIWGIVYFYRKKQQSEEYLYSLKIWSAQYFWALKNLVCFCKKKIVTIKSITIFS